MTPKPSIGGQAVMEGVMMRGPFTWAVAVRKPDKEIVAETYPLPEHAQKHRWMRLPLIRGVYVLIESLAIGMRALRISASYALEEESDTTTDEKRATLSERSIGITMVIALIFFSAIFIALPTLISQLGGRAIGSDSRIVRNVLEGGIRIGFFLGYIFLISLLPDIKRVFQYHGAEHKTIYAYENDDPLEPEVVDRYSTLHVRCGTNFLFIVMFLSIVFHFFADLLLYHHALPLRIGARVLAIPLIAGTAYEVIKAASRKGDSLLLKIVSLPGMGLQKITTRPPTTDQIEVAIKAMEAVIARESLKEPAVTKVEFKPIIEPSPGTAPATPG
jgi:uncharacterized protein YqhQ